jgi:hypothetical protein
MYHGVQSLLVPDSVAKEQPVNIGMVRACRFRADCNLADRTLAHIGSKVSIWRAAEVYEAPEDLETLGQSLAVNGTSGQADFIPP